MISALIISFYDHNYIEECIASLSFVDEIIVIGKIDPVVLSGIEHQNLVQFIESENLNFLESPVYLTLGFLKFRKLKI